MTRYAPSMKRAGMLVACLVAAAPAAHADKKLQDLAPNFIKESASCVIEARGLAAIVGGSTLLAGTLTGTERDAVTKDLATLTAANAKVATWCASLEDLL